MCFFAVVIMCFYAVVLTPDTGESLNFVSMISSVAVIALEIKVVSSRLSPTPPSMTVNWFKHRSSESSQPQTKYALLLW